MKKTCGAVLVTVLLLVLGACGGSEGDSGIEPIESEPTTSVITDTAAANPGERPDDTLSEAGAIAFSEFAVRSIIAARAMGDPEDFLAISSGDCQTCAEYGRQILDSEDTEYRYDGPIEIEAGKVVDNDEDEYVVEQNVSVPERQEVDPADESVVSDADASDLNFRVRLVWSNDTWVLGGYETEEIS